MPQTTFDDIRKRQTLDQLTDKQKRIIRLLAEGQTQSLIAKTMRTSRSSVNQFTSFLEENNLIKKQVNIKYNILYEVSPQIQRKVGGEVSEPLTPYRVHNIAAVYKIQQQNHPVSEDKRSGFSWKWQMRGGVWWYAFKFPGKAGEINTTVTVYPNSIKIQMDTGQKIIGKDAIDAQERGLQYLANVRQRFIDCQRKFGVILEIESTGRRSGKAHAGLIFHEGGPLDSETRIPGTWVDESVTKELGKGWKEFELHVGHDMMTPLEQGVVAVAKMPDIFPKMINDAINPLSQNVDKVLAQIQGGRPIEAMFQQALGLISQMMEKMNRMDDEIRELKGK